MHFLASLTHAAVTQVISITTKYESANSIIMLCNAMKKCI